MAGKITVPMRIILNNREMWAYKGNREEFSEICCYQISEKRGPVVEVNTESLVYKSNSRRSEYVMVRG